MKPKNPIGKKASSQSLTHLWRGISVFLLSFLIILFLWYSYKEEQVDQIQDELELHGGYLQERIQTMVNENILSLDHLAKRIVFTQGDFYAHWKYDAQLLIKMHPSIQFIEVIDSQMVIQDVYPLEPNKGIVGLDLNAVEYRRKSWLKNTADSNLNITSWQKMIQGGEAFLIDAPLYYNERFQGTVTAGFNFHKELTQLISGLDRFQVELFDDQGRRFYHYPEESTTHALDFEPFVQSIHLHEKSSKDWKLSVALLQSNYFSELNRLGYLSLSLGLLISVLAGIIVYNVGRLRVANSRVREVNKNLIRANYELKNERLTAQKASQSKTNFISTMSHEMRTPLNAILGFLGLLRQENLSETGKDYLRMMDVSSKGLLSLINDILDIDKIESGKVVLDEEPFLPTAELMDLIDSFQPEFEAKGLKLITNFNRNQGSTVLGDSGKFLQIFTNLIRNSFKFTESGEVILDYNEENINGQVKITVHIKDTGIGIPKEKLESIFERFTQIGSGLSRKYEGSGLGLTICKNLAELMNGKIVATSEENVGSTFTVELNLELANVVIESSDKSVELRTSFEGAKVLIAEDNAINQMFLKRVLTQMGIEVEVAFDGAEAVEKTKSIHFDLILMDLHMPEMDGIEAATTLIAQSYDKPIVALTADVTRESMASAKHAGMQGYITKPIDKRKLLEVLNQFL